MSKPTKSAGKARNALLAIGSIVRDPRLQMRESGVIAAHVADIAEAIKAGRPIERVRVWHVGDQLLLTEGYHRVAAYEQAGVEKVPAVVTDGDWTDAVVDSSQANKNHFALKRSNADKRLACTRLIEEIESSGRTGWSVAKYAKTVDVSPPLAKELLDAYVERRLAATGEGIIEDAGQFKAKDVAGLPTLFTEPHVPEFRVGADGRKRAVKPKTEKPRMPEPDFGVEPEADVEFTESEPEEVQIKAIEIKEGQYVAMSTVVFGGKDWPESAAEKLLKAAEEKKDAKPAAVGRPKVDWAKIEAACGLLARSLDDVEAIDAYWRNSVDQRNCQTLLNRYLEAWRKFSQRIKERQQAAEFEAAKAAF